MFPPPTPVLLPPTQDACPECERLEQTLARPLRGHYDDLIGTAHRQKNAAEFAALAEPHGPKRTPVLIHAGSGELLTRTGSLGEVRHCVERPARGRPAT